jgi:single-stranded-DNA-specific exonuclease
LGILPILAAKILEKYNQSVILWGQGDTDAEIKGSCRSNGKINLVELLNEIGNKIFVEFGGHPQAAGFTVKKNKVSDLNKEVEKAYEKISHQEIESSVLWLDAELDLKNINWDFLSLLQRFQPFGMGNPKPVFLLKNLEIFEAKSFGNGGIHLKLNFKKPSGEIIPAIGFFMFTPYQTRSGAGQKRFSFPIEKGTKIDLAACVEKNTYNGSTELRLRIVDIRPALQP